MDKRIIFFDIDGTLLNAKGEVPESTKMALRELKEAGHLRFVCTGRTKCMMPEAVEALDFDGFVFGGGTQVDYDGNVLKCMELDTQLIKKSVAVLKKYGFVYLFEGSSNIYYEAEAEAEERAYFSSFVKSFGSLAKVIKDYDEIHASKITLVPPAGFTKERLEAFKGELDSEFNVIVHEPVNNGILTDGLIELVPAGTNKATGIKDAIHFLNMEQEATVGVGDSNNDLEMLAFTGTSICMGNGTKKAKELATFLAKHIDEDGIYDAMKALKYI